MRGPDPIGGVRAARGSDPCDTVDVRREGRTLVIRSM